MIGKLLWCPPPPSARLLKKLRRQGRRLRENRSVLSPYVRIHEEARTQHTGFLNSLLVGVSEEGGCDDNQKPKNHGSLGEGDGRFCGFGGIGFVQNV